MANDPVSITELTNILLDKNYAKVAGPMLKQISLLTSSPTSPLQKALRELDDEATRLEAEQKRMEPSNAVLLKTLDTIEQTYVLVGELLKANASQVQASGASLAPSAVTAKVWGNLSRNRVGLGIDPMSPQAMSFYLKTLKDLNIPWRIG